MHRLLSALSGCALPLLLTACAPHPATGTWTTIANATDPFVRLELTYEGRGLLYAAGEKEAGRHCFWAGESVNVVRLACKPAFNTALEERYRLNLAGHDSAELLHDDQVVAHLRQVATAGTAN